MNLTHFYEQLNEANDIIKNIKLPTEYTTKPKPTPKPTPKPIHTEADLNLFKKNMNIVNYGYLIIRKSNYIEPEEGHEYWLLHATKWNKNKNRIFRKWNKTIKSITRINSNGNIYKSIEPKVDSLFKKLKTKKHILSYFAFNGIDIVNSRKKLKKDDMINQIKDDFKTEFIYNHSVYNTLNQRFLLSLK